MLPDLGVEYYVYGSKDSLDTDVLVVHSDAAGLEKDKDLWLPIKTKYEEEYPFIADWKPNVILIENGYVKKSVPSKGDPDGVNNSLFETYHLHEQRCAFPLRGRIDRDINMAIAKCLNVVFTFYKHRAPQLHKLIPKEVKNGSADLEIILGWLRSMDLTQTPNFDGEDKVGVYKRIGFLLGQTISLITGVEIYTKQELVYYHPALAEIIKRIPLDSYAILNDKCKALADNIQDFKQNSK